MKRYKRAKKYFQLSYPVYFSSKYMLYSCSNSLLANLGMQFTLMISLNPSSMEGGLYLALYWLKRGSLILAWFGSVSSLKRLLCLK